VHGGEGVSVLPTAGAVAQILAHQVVDQGNGIPPVIAWWKDRLLDVCRRKEDSVDQTFHAWIGQTFIKHDGNREKVVRIPRHFPIAQGHIVEIVSPHIGEARPFVPPMVNSLVSSGWQGNGVVASLVHNQAITHCHGRVGLEARVTHIGGCARKEMLIR